MFRESIPNGSVHFGVKLSTNKVLKYVSSVHAIRFYIFPKGAHSCKQLHLRNEQEREKEISTT